MRRRIGGRGAAGVHAGGQGAGLEGECRAVLLQGAVAAVAK